MKAIKKSHARISTKLLISFAAVLALVLGLSFSSLTAIGRLGASLDTAVNTDARKLRLFGEIHTGFEAMRADSTKVEMSLVNALIGRLGARKENSADAECSSCHTRENVNAQKQRFEEAGATLRRSIAETRSLASAAGERSALDTLDSKVNEWLQLYGSFLNFAWDRDFNSAHEIMLGKIYPLIEDLDKGADQLVAGQQTVLGTASQEARARVAGSRLVAFLLLGLCLAVGGAVYWIVRGVNHVLREFASELERVTDQATASACQVSSSSHSLAEGAARQAASLEDTSSSSQEINSMARQSAASSKIAAEKMEEAAQRIDGANLSLRQMVSSMDAISASSDKISRIIKVIDEIAFQTNILALNAAVEAARAGEAGLGFAVVAGEVRNLAQRCAQAARDTAGLIEESIAMSQDGKGKFAQVVQAILSISESASQVKILVDGINVSSQEQTRRVEEAAEAISQVEKVTHANAASAHQGAAAGEELNAQSAALKNIVENLAALV